MDAIIHKLPKNFRELKTERQHHEEKMSHCIFFPDGLPADIQVTIPDIDCDYGFFEPVIFDK